MKSGVILGSLILLSFVLVGSFGVVSGEEDTPTIIPSVSDTSNYVTETITCKFVDIKTGEPFLSEQANCFDSFHYGHLEIPSEEVEREDGQGTYTTQLQYQCSNNEGECSITIKGEKGSKIKWNSFCFGEVSGAGIESWGRLVSNPNLTTTIDGTDKIVEILCVDQLTVQKMFSALANFWYSLFGNEPKNMGARGGYVLCMDGSESIIDNNPPFCEESENIFNILTKKCENKCDISGLDCGAYLLSSFNSCDLDNPEINVRKEVSQTINP